MAEAASLRVVPGAPPPLTLTKSQKKKRKTAIKGQKSSDEGAETSPVITDAHTAALVDKSPTAADVEDGAVASELVAVQTESGVESTGKKASPIVDLLNKRLKVVSKKIVSQIFSSHKRPPIERYYCKTQDTNRPIFLKASFRTE